MGSESSHVIRGREQLPLPSAEPSPSHFTRERALMSVGLTTVLVGVGLQLAKAFGGSLPWLPDWSVWLLAAGEIIPGMLVLKLKHETEMQRVKEESARLDTLRPGVDSEAADTVVRVVAVKREYRVNLLALAVGLTALGIQPLVQVFNYPLPFSGHLIYILSGASMVGGGIGLWLEAKRRMAEEKELEKLSGAGLGQQHQVSHIQVGMAVLMSVGYAMALTGLGMQIAQAFQHPVPHRYLIMTGMAGTGALMGIVGQRMEYWYEVQHKKRLQSAGLLTSQQE